MQSIGDGVFELKDSDESAEGVERIV
jgi:hypothetical protein